MLSIHSLSTTGGFLAQAPVEFAPGLTCIIGARGTCKSTLVETIRFLFNCDKAKIDALCSPTVTSPDHDAPSTHGLIRATLQGAVARCTVVRNNPVDIESITIEREVDCAPRIYRDGIEELVDHDVLHQIEIYSQGDLQRIAEDESLRLELIDRPHKGTIKSLQDKRKAIAAGLKESGPEIRSKAALIEARRADVRALDSLKSQLADIRSLRPQLSQELDLEREAALKRKDLLQAVQQGMAERSRMYSSIRKSIETGVDLVALSSALRTLQFAHATELAETFDQLTEFRRGIFQKLREIEGADLAPSVAGIQAEFEGENARYYHLRQEQQEVNESLKREDNVKQQIAHLEKLQSELDAFLEEHRTLLQRRNEFRVQLQQIADQIHSLRQQEVERINIRHADVVILSLEHGSRSPDYAQRLSILLQGSRLRAQEDVARDLALHVRPADLVDIVESADSQRLATMLDRDLGQMARLVSFLMDRPQLYELEGVVFEDRLEITMFDKDVPKPVNQLSKGQMATALLPLILRPAAYPLVFDQPEDDLDNSFIYRTLVQEVQRLKQERQLIFVTHNANIPVLGDADAIVVMEMATPKQAAQPIIGSVDDVKTHILNLLEGGSEAFRRREEKYHSVLAQDAAQHATY